MGGEILRHCVVSVNSFRLSSRAWYICTTLYFKLRTPKLPRGVRLTKI